MKEELSLMKVGIYHWKNHVGVEERPIPEVGPKDALVRILAGGICGTNINIVKAGSEMGIRFYVIQNLNVKSVYAPKI